MERTGTRKAGVGRSRFTHPPSLAIGMHWPSDEWQGETHTRCHFARLKRSPIGERAHGRVSRLLAMRVHPSRKETYAASSVSQLSMRRTVRKESNDGTYRFGIAGHSP